MVAFLLRRGGGKAYKNITSIICMAKAGRGFYRSSPKNVIKIFRALRKAYDDGDDYLSVREIARRTGLHQWTVSRTVDLWMRYVVDVVMPEELEHVGLRIKLVRLINPKTTEDKVLRAMGISNV